MSPARRCRRRQPSGSPPRWPHGASEFLDRDVAGLRRAGVAHAAAVLSYNDSAFEDRAEAFAGMMALTEPAAVQVSIPRRWSRASTSAVARAVVPMVMDLKQGTMCWLAVANGVTGRCTWYTATPVTWRCSAGLGRAVQIRAPGSAWASWAAGRPRPRLGRAPARLAGALLRFVRRPGRTRPRSPAGSATVSGASAGRLGHP